MVFRCVGYFLNYGHTLNNIYSILIFGLSLCGILLELWSYMYIKHKNYVKVYELNPYFLGLKQIGLLVTLSSVVCFKE